MGPMRRSPSQSSRAGRTPHHWRRRHLGEEDSAELTMLVGSARASLECAAAGTLGASSSAEPPLAIVAAAGVVLEAGTVQGGITGARRQRPKVLTWRSPLRPMRRSPSQSSRAGRTPHHWRRRHLGEEDFAQLTMLVGSARVSLECAAAGTLGASFSAEPPLAIVVAAGTVQVSVEFFI